MKNALILHGTLGNSQENWFPWLKAELEKKGYEVWLPNLPGSDKPDLKKYNDFIFSNSNFKFGPETIIIGHSSGAVAILALLNSLPDKTKIKTAILVSPFEKESPGGKWEPNSNLFNFEFDINEIKTMSEKFVLFISDNDKYCPVDYVQRLGKDLSGTVIETKGDGHFSVSSGGEKYKKLPIVLKYIE